MSLTIQPPLPLTGAKTKKPVKKAPPQAAVPARQEILFSASDSAKAPAGVAGKALLAQRGLRFGSATAEAERPVIPPAMLDPALKSALLTARKEAQKPGLLTLEHFLLALLNNKDSSQAFRRMLIKNFKIAPDKFKEMLESSLAQLNARIPANSPVRQPRQDAEFAEAFNAMMRIAQEQKTTINMQTVALAALKLPNGRIASMQPSLSITDLAKDEDEQKILDKFFHDVTFDAEIGKLPPIIGRDEELINTITTMAQSKKASVVYVGPAGVGKTATIEKLAQLNANGWKELGGKIPELFQQKDEDGNPILLPAPGANGQLEMKPLGKRTLELNLSLLADPQLGSEDREAVIKFALALQNRCDIYIDELHVLNRPENTALANQLKPYLAREFKIIGATTDDEFRKVLAKDPALERRFTKVRTEEPSVQQALTILRGSRQYFEKSHGVELRDDALQTAAEKAKRYLSQNKLPDSAITLVDKTCARKKIELQVGSLAVMRLQSRIREIDINRQGLQARSNETQEEDHTLSKAFSQDVEAFYSRLLGRHRDEQWLSGDDDEVTKFKALGFNSHDNRDHTVKRKMLAAVDRKLVETDPEAKKWHDYMAEFAPEIFAATKSYAKSSQALATLKDEAAKESKRLKDEREELVEQLQVEDEKAISPIVTTRDILQTVEEMTGTPVSQMEEDEMLKLKNMEAELGKSVIGQKAAIHAISNKIRSNRMGNGDPRKPIGTFLLPGSTGVGKTELAKALAKYLFDDEKAMVRIDMSEYMEKHAAMRLTGAPPSYVGYEEGGVLTEAVRKRPYSVVLFDEVEKAHPDVWNLMLQIMDDGRLTDGQGNTVDFKDTVIIYTTNLGSQLLLGPFKQRGTNGDMDPESQAFRDACQDMQKVAMATLRKGMKPEVLNRFSDVVACHPLMNAHLGKILDLILKRVNTSFAAGSVKVQVELTPDARQYLIKEGANFEFGARPLEKFVDKKVKEPINGKILEGVYGNGETIVVDLNLIKEWESEPRSNA